MRIALIHTHRAAHHDEQIGLGQIDRAKAGITHVDPVERISRGLDRRAISRNSLVGNMADDKAIFSCRLNGHFGR